MLYRNVVWVMFFYLLTPLSQAEQVKQVEDFNIHYNTLATGFLTPEVAKSYGIVRSKQRAMLTVAVRKGDIGADVAVAANITAQAINLNQQLKTIELTPIREADALYYIGTFRIYNAETLDFTLQVQPDGYTSSQPIEIKFRQQFFVD